MTPERADLLEPEAAVAAPFAERRPHDRRAPASEPVRFATDLARHGDRPALVAADGTTTSYPALAAGVADVARRLGTTRRLVAIEGGNRPEAVTTYLGALAGGHVALLLPPGTERTGPLLTTYTPDVVARADDGWALHEERRGTAHDLHPELALLLTTSGSTGSPKLVRLSAANLDANAASIAEYLALGPDDRAITSLPLHYCYGLSVLHSHLLAGGALSLSELSVTDPCFWAQARRDAVTGLAGVPYTYELLERVGLDGLLPPSLRYLTQAGGRMPPERVQRVAAWGREHQVDLFVMYGQTEATARMAYLPPAVALERPTAIGVAIPGGELAVDAPAGEVGELVYRGPNVMLGYAGCAQDLALGRTVRELRTGDLGRLAPDGLFEVVGRVSRFLKLFGLRVDLDRAERLLADHGATAVCTGDDHHLVVGVTAVDGTAASEVPDLAVERVTQLAAAQLGLPRHAVAVVLLDEVPRLSTGKPDLRAVRQLAATAVPPPVPTPSSAEAGGGPGADAPVRATVAATLGLDPADIGPSDTFVGLGGDSLSYVEMSVELEGLLGAVPPTWHLTPVAELEALAAAHRREAGAGRRRPRRTHVMEANVVLRAAATALIVATHAGVLMLQGGAHVLLAVAGFNFARFRLPPADRPSQLRDAVTSLARIAVPTAVWLAFQFTYAEPFEWPRALLVNNYLGTGLWEYWYLEALLQVLVVLTVVFAWRRARTFERRHPFGVAMGVLVAATALRFDALDVGHDAHWMYMPDTVLWCFALGWAAQRALTGWQRAAVTVLGAINVWDFFDKPGRELAVAVGLVVLVWVARVRVPTGLHRVVAAVAAASLYVYLVQWAVLPPLRGVVPPWLAAIAAVVVGLLAFLASQRLERRVAAWWAARRSPADVTEPAEPASVG